MGKATDTVAIRNPQRHAEIDDTMLALRTLTVQPWIYHADHEVYTLGPERTVPVLRAEVGVYWQQAGSQGRWYVYEVPAAPEGHGYHA